MTRWGDDRGAALAAVLLMLAVMSMLAAVVVDAAGSALNRTANQAQMDQSRWYLLGAEAFALTRARDLALRQEEGVIDASEWQARSFDFQLDDGAMRVALWDASNCFNVNGLVSSSEADGGYVGNPGAQIEFGRLLDLLEVRSQSGESLVAAVVDWLDSDDQQGMGGAEAEAYEGAFTVANGLMGDISELQRVKGFSQELVERLSPLVCTRPAAQPNVLNPNTLEVQSAALLSAVIGDALPPDNARDLLRNRPAGGWRSLDDFFSAPMLRELELDEGTRASFSLRTDQFVMAATVTRGDTQEGLAALIDASGAPRTVRRVFGPVGSERSL